MQIKRKILKYPFLISIASAVILFIVALVGKVESYFKSGLTTFEQAHLGFEMLEMDPALCEWIENENSTVEANQYQKETISSSYLKAWKWLNASMENSDLRGMEDYFKEIPTSKILNNLRHTDGQISQADLQHHLILKHLSEDHTVAVIEDKNVWIKSTFTNHSGAIISNLRLYNFEVHLILEDGQWKIFNWTSEVVNQKNKIKTHENSIKEANLEYIKTVKGINYYPAKNPWLTFWDNYESATINKDFKKIKTLGFNTIRIFLQVESFGRNEINYQAIHHLDDLLCLAKQHQLHVIPTLFDFPIGFETRKLPTYYRQLTTIVNRYKDDQTILAWNIKNEPDLDFNIYGQDMVTDWLNFIIESIKNIDQNHPVTIGWSDIDYAHILAEKTDYISVHYYRNPSQLPATIKRLQQIGKLTVVEEFGYSSSQSIWNLYQTDEITQDKHAGEVLAALESAQIPWLVWTLYDFVEAPVDVFGWNPVLRSSQKGFGILDKNGNLKPFGQRILNYNFKSPETI